MARRPTQKQLLAELLEKYGPEIAAAFRAAIDDLRAGADLQGIITALDRGDIEGALQALHLDRAAYDPLEAKIREAYAAAGQQTARTLPSAVSLGFRFTVGNPAAEQWLREHSSKLITGIVQAQREDIRMALIEGVQLGAHPRTVALDIVGRISRVTGKREGGIIGLSAPQRAALDRARIELASNDPALLRNYLTRARRDRRFDASIRKAIRTGQALPAATAKNAGDRYGLRLEQLRGEVIGRQEALNAVRSAKFETYSQLELSGIQGDLIKDWSDAGDNRVRDTHEAMDGQSQPFRRPFVSPSGAQMMFPGDTSLGAGSDETLLCRCDFAVRFVAWPSMR